MRGCSSSSALLILVSTYRAGSRTISEVRARPRSSSIRANIVFRSKFRRRLVGYDGQFAVAHLDCSPECEALLGGIVHFFCVRDLRNVLLSFMRFSLDSRRKDRPKDVAEFDTLQSAAQFARFLEGRLAGDYLRGRIAPITGWIGRSGLTVLRFEDISGASGPDAQVACFIRILSQLGVDPPNRPIAPLLGTSSS